MLILDWAGELRTFKLPLGKIMDLEQACGKVGIGAIYARLASHQFFARDVYQVIFRGLIGGGMADVEAKQLLDERFDVAPMSEHVNLALQILLSLMEGVEPDEARKGDPEKPIDVGRVLHSFVQAGIAPEQVRAMSYADFVNILRAAGRKDADDAPSEQEFEEMLARFGAGHGE